MAEEELREDAVKDEGREDASSPSASEESASDEEKEEIKDEEGAVEEQPTEDIEETEAPSKKERGSRASQRIRQLVKERDYWKKVATGELPPPVPESAPVAGGYQAPSVPPEYAEIAAVARREAEMAIQIKEAEEKFPQLKKDDELAAAVIGTWQAARQEGKEITIAEAAERLIKKIEKAGGERGRKEALKEVAEKTAGGATPSGKSGTRKTPLSPEEIAKMPPEEYEKYREEIWGE